ncbi:class I SAM-dependent methyltransferase [Actinomadura chibensis]|uniref:Class I SAM-dependent methyltransferase n=1 Tax=Actinomadura chibensis TaxID=392828 RepID=A0A5D0NY21_9ACTN|nr:class I SAM-dependent methyltransferase [Actinomadura chibensis]TYB49029.1 class I SAM-dependent methyltransferase [Actinomadura chibensis]
MYESFAHEYADHAEDSSYNAFYDRPAVLGLAGDVAGLAVFDAACGPGLYARELLERGARVTGCDASPTFVEMAGERCGGRADLRVHDLSEPLDWVPDGSADLVVCALALHYIDDRVALLREFRRILTPSGAVVLSTEHPTTGWLRLGGSYFTEEPVEESLSPEREWPIRAWRRPLTAICAEFRAAGFVIDELLEPRPVPEMAERYPDDHAKLEELPAFIAFRLVPRAVTGAVRP